jgi:hypothetical protein
LKRVEEQSISNKLQVSDIRKPCPLKKRGQHEPNTQAREKYDKQSYSSGAIFIALPPPLFS